VTFIMKNLFTDIPENLKDELFQTILQTPDFRVERIVSRGHGSPERFWYDQDENEWVILLKGSAGFRFKDQDDVLVLNSGDYLHINKHRKHRVEWTDSQQETIWLAVYYK
jgi:cupin 2 domain-containing protein